MPRNRTVLTTAACSRSPFSAGVRWLMAVVVVLSFGLGPFGTASVAQAQVAPPAAAPPMVALEIFAQVPVLVPPPLANGPRADSTVLQAGAPVGSAALFVIFGAVSAVNAAGTEWQIGTPPTFVYTHAGTVLQGAPAAGSTVRIVGTRTLTPGPIMAEVITLRPGAATGAAAIETAFLFNGTVTAASPTLWTVGGVDFNVDGAAIDPGLGLASAVTVEFSVPVVIPPPPPGTVVAPPPIPAAAPAAAPMTFGAVNPTTRVPLWFRDAAGIALDFCVDPVLCIADPVDPANPFSVQTGFGAEAFFWAAEASMPTNGGNALLVLAWEVAYLNEDPIPGDTIMFGRIRVFATGLTPDATYTVTHPFGTDTYVAGPAIGRQIQASDDTGCFTVPCDFNALSASRVKRFLVWDPAQSAPPPGFVGDGATPHKVIGSPFGTNFFRIDGPNVGGPGINTVQTDRFVVSGRILRAAPAGISISPANAVIAVGNTVLLTAVTADQFGAPIATPVTLTSSNPAVGTINPLTGVFTAIAPDTTTITATSGALTGTTTITVSTATPVLTTISITPATALVVVPNTQAFSAAARDQFSAVFTTTPTFSSSNPLVGTVNPATGLFTAVGAGTATVTATSGTVTGTATVRVTAAAPTLGSITITPPTATVAMGTRPTFTASALDQFGVAIPASATFASSNGAVGAINAAGVFTPVGTGTTTITATSGTISGSATVTVTSPGMRAVGPVNPASGYPYFVDANGLALELCLDNNGFCVLPGVEVIGGVTTFDPARPIANPGNLPEEGFYYFAGSTLSVGPTGAGRANFRLVLESAFASAAPALGQQIVFHRINLARISGLSPNSTYTVTHPFGAFDISTDAAGNTTGAPAAFRLEEGCFGTPCDFTLVLPVPVTGMSTFLTWTGLPPGGLAGPGGNYIGDNSTPHTITPGPNGNFFRITGPNVGGPGVNSVQTDLWLVSGKIVPAAVVAAASAPVAAAAPTPIGAPVAALATINVTPATATVVAGGALAFSAAGLDQFGAPFTATPAFSSGNPAVGTVNPVTGLFTAIAAGTTTITAASGAISGSATITVLPAPVAPVVPVVPVTPATPAVPAVPPRVIFGGGGGGGGGGGRQIFGGGGSGVSGGGAVAPGTAPAAVGGRGQGSGRSPVLALPPGTLAPARGRVRVTPAPALPGSPDTLVSAPHAPVIVEMGGKEYRVDFSEFKSDGPVSTVISVPGSLPVAYGANWQGFTPDEILANAIWNNLVEGQAVALAAGATSLAGGGTSGGPQ